MSRDLIAWALALKNSGSMINPMQSLNDLIIGGNDGTPTRFSTTGNNKYLHTNASTGNIEWVDAILANVNWGDISGTLTDQTDLKNALDNKQATLVSGTNIKTINSTSLLGSGNIDTKELFYCTHGTTTFAEITTALSNNKLPICVYNDNRYYIYCNSSSTVHRFSSMQSDYVRYITVDDTDTWSNVQAYNLQLVSNKSTSISSTGTDTNYPTTKAVYDYTQAKLTTTSVNDGTINKCIGFDSQGNIVKATPSSGATVQDLTSNTAGTLDATAWGNLKTTHSATISSPTMTGLDSTYSFVDIKLSINSVNQIVKLTKNTTSKYSGLFFIEESTNLFEITTYYNGTNIILRCATVY